MPENLENNLRDLTIEAEEDLLGGLMLASVVLGDDLALSEVKSMIAPSDFLDYSFHGDRARIYGAIISCDQPDIVTVTFELLKQGNLKSDDGDYLRRLIMGVPTSYNYMEYARIVKSLSEKRQGSTKNGGVNLRIKLHEHSNI